ncbi:phosphate transport system permease protein [Candidatus Electrothrix aarhusensis]|uniref:Phosphate transport system permease protein PstA n=1 Tax=Candidatus Electrothrix aarhusensis TaxID=1859131 RepID=A0A444IPV7_9BACT|nr:phosphate transport system permease protein [Candidatus Electrothrix aarhusensis]
MGNQKKNKITTKASAMERAERNLIRRRRKEDRFRRLSFSAVVLSLGFLVLLFASIISNGWSAFLRTDILLDVHFDREVLDVNSLVKANYGKLVKQAMRDVLPDVTSRRDKREMYRLVSSGAAYTLQKMVTADPALIGKTVSLWLPADDLADMLMKGRIDRDTPESERAMSDKQMQWIDQLIAQGRLERHFNTTFFQAGDSREPELAGIRGAVMGSLFTLLVTLVLSFPVAVASAIYLEEFAPKNRWTDLVEVNINNLAAVPSIVFGLLGLAVFLNFFGMPRSSPLVGGLVLSLMTLPTIIIASRASLQAVPPSIREAALGVGASKMQTVFHHVLPLAMPGMMTGTIIGLSRALGETAPLLMIGMVAFIVDVPASITDPATGLPVQIFLWADSPERAFVERTSAAILVLLTVLISMNGLAVYLRMKFERRW